MTKQEVNTIMSVLNRDRTLLGTFKSKYDEPMEKLSVRVPKSVAAKISKLPNKTEFLRELIIKASKEIDDK
jgi:hypothetical protein